MIQTAHAGAIARRIRNAGAIFIGPNSPVPLGDYSAGSTHVLPTGGAARYSSGLTVRSFLRSIHVIEYDRQALGEVGERVQVLQYVSEALLEALYARARCLLYLSSYEGFGLPVLEAMAQGVPVVTSRGTATEEVAGGAAVLVDPGDVDSIAGGLAAALSDPSGWSAAALGRAGAFSWPATAEATVAVYREAAR